MRPLLAKGLPLSSVTSVGTDTNTMKAASSQSKQFKGAVQLRVFGPPLTICSIVPPELAPRWFGRPSSKRTTSLDGPDADSTIASQARRTRYRVLLGIPTVSGSDASYPRLPPTLTMKNESHRTSRSLREGRF